MKKYLLILVFLSLNNLAFAQIDSVFVWENYLPKSEVDSIVILSTDTLDIINDNKYFSDIKKQKVKRMTKKRKKMVSQRWENHQAYKNKINTMLTYGKFDLNNYQEYINHYKKKNLLQIRLMSKI